MLNNLMVNCNNVVWRPVSFSKLFEQNEFWVVNKSFYREISFSSGNFHALKNWFFAQIFISVIMSFLFTTTTLNFLLQTSSEGESPALIVLKIYVLPSFSHTYIYTHTVSICPNRYTLRHWIHIYIGS